MPWPPDEIAADLTDATVMETIHPGHHNELATAVNDIVERIDTATVPLPASPAQVAHIINTDADSGRTIYVGSIDPDVSYAPAVGDVWIEVP